MLTDGIYDYKMDIWAVGCVLYEMLTKNPLFPGSDEFDQILKIHQVVGSPSDDTAKRMFGLVSLDDFNCRMKPKFQFERVKGKGIASMLPRNSRACIDLINATLQYDPLAR